MAVGKSAPALRRVGGLIIMLIGAGLVAWGAHYLAINGTCSSTGYVSYGPVPTCHGPEGLYITATFFGGPFVMLIGWGMARIPSVLWPVFCVFLATSFASIDLDKNESSGAHTFGLVLGAAFLALALFSVVTTVRKRLAGPPPAPQPNPAMAGMYAAPDSAADGASSGFTTVTPFTPASRLHLPHRLDRPTRSTRSLSSPSSATAARLQTRSSNVRRPSCSRRCS
jgi:hypothetical protein